MEGKETLSSDYEFLTMVRENIFERLTALLDYLKAQPLKAEQKKLQARFSLLDELKASYTANEAEIMRFNSKVSDPKVKIPYRKQRATVDDMIVDIINEFETRMEEASQVEEPVSQTQLPKISIPTFSGGFREWHSFKELFTAVIHKSSLPNVEKFQRLKCYLQGDALKLIDHIELTGNNYQIAFDTLLSRYDNPRLAANSYLNALLNYRPVNSDSYSALQGYLNHHLDNVKAFSTLPLPDHLDYVLFQICYNHLDHKSQREFDSKYPVDVFPKYEELMNFVQIRLRTLEMHSADGDQKSRASKPNVKHSFNVITRGHVNSQSASGACPMCSQTHPLYMCPKFNKFPISERYNFLKGNNLCFNCFKGHQRKLCTSNKKCKKCEQQHHTLLHIDAKPESIQKPPPADETNALSHTMTCRGSNNITKPKSILLGTVQGYLRNANRDQYVPARILLDPGSQVSCISEELATKLEAEINPKITHIKGVSGMSAKSSGMARCQIYVSPNGVEALSANLLVLPSVSVNLPKINVLPSVRERFQRFKLADPKFDQSGSVDVLIGADHYYDVVTDRRILRGEPNGIHTVFGIVLIGHAPSVNESTNGHSFLVIQEPLESLLSKFWELEELPNVTIPVNDACEVFFQKTTTRTSTGRYVVALPFLTGASEVNLGENRSNALQRLFGMERRFQRTPELKSEYSRFMDEYVTLGHMSVAKTPAKYVIPHHAVFKESTTTKLRVVFDASNLSTTGMSLNQLLEKGPKLQPDLFLTLSGFRVQRIALVADIAKMYRQILVRPEDRRWQHIFWRKDSTDPVIEFELQTLTYGIASSSYLAQRVIRQLVIDEGASFPLASKALTQQIYVDDIVSGGSTVEEALQLYSELTELLGRGGFFPRKWASSSPEVLAEIPEEHKETPVQLQDEHKLTYKVLGLRWDSKIDAFMYKVERFQGQPTKRTVLSYIARMYDPLGWLSPFVFYCKHLMQLLWLEGTGWDEPLPAKLTTLWHNLTSNLECLCKIRVPRWIPINEAEEITVVGFCDASERGYAATLFLRCRIGNSVEVHLLAGKSKVAPINPLSIPRLELNAASLLAKLIEAFKPFLDRLPNLSTLLFSDSQIVLAWLRTPPHKLQTYVRNRVVEIVSKTSPSFWHHVKSEENPSDCASRGLTPEELLKHSLWWSGPGFLYEKTLSPIKGSSVEDLPELKRESLIVMANTDCNDKPPPDSILCSLEKFSSFSKLVRVLAYNLRFIHHARHTLSHNGPLKVSELRLATEKCVQLNQNFYFQREIQMLRTRSLPNTLRTLSPFLDEKGLLRVGGRLKNAPLPFSARHPLLIPPKTPLARLIVEQYHKTTLHGGPQIMRSSIQAMYWIPKIGHTIKSVLFGCRVCRRFKVKPLAPVMADLPPTRFDQVRPFLRSGVDFAGPFTARETLRRKSFTFKCYVCLFICFSTKAVHLEVVNSLTTDAFLAAVDRFVARRGLCAYLHSDNGTNFVGAARKLAEVQTFIAQVSGTLEERLSTRQIQWIFNPPGAPHFGGLCEAAVKVFKLHFQKIVGAHTFTLEEFTTLTCRVEAVLNSRPLCPLNNPADAELCLTPGHFLIGSALTSVPELPLRDASLNRLTRWQLISQNVQHFWKLWSRSYLQTLMPRKKWNIPQAPLQEGEVVLVRDLTTSPLVWPLARVVEIISGKDNIGRVAKILCNGRTLTRPVHKLCKIFS